MNDTPRSDAFEAAFNRPLNWWDFARELERENAALRDDKARLDWLDKTGCWLTITGQKNFVSGSARAVIDAAMGEGK